MSTLLIIGGTGFFGKSFLDSFQRGQLDEWGINRIIAMSRNAQRLRAEAPELLDERVELLNADIGTTEWLPSADYVIHAAASTDARNYLGQPEAERQNIQAGVYNYCRLAPKYHLNSKILYVSSGAVYGSQPPDLEFIDESYEVKDAADIPEGKRDYAIAKRDAEAALKRLAAEGLNVFIARCFAFVGRWLPRVQHFAIGNFIEDGLQGRPIKVKATHPVYRSYMYADDLVKWLMVMVDKASSACEIYNVGSDQAVSMGELAACVAEVFGTTVDKPTCAEEKIDRYIPSIEKAKRKLGLSIEVNLRNAIQLSCLKSTRKNGL